DDQLDADGRLRTPRGEQQGPRLAARTGQGRRQSAPLPRGRPGSAAAELAGPSLERRLRLLVRRPRRGSDPQLLPRDRSAQQQAEGVRDGRPPRGAGADRLPARPRRRSPDRVGAGARAPDRREPDEALPNAADPDREDPGVPEAHRARRARQALPLLAERLPRARRRLQRAEPGDGRRARRRRRGAGGRARERPAVAAGRVRPRLRARGDRRDRDPPPEAGGAAGDPDRRGRERRRALAEAEDDAFDRVAPPHRREVALGTRAGAASREQEAAPSADQTTASAPTCTAVDAGGGPGISSARSRPYSRSAPMSVR